MMIGASKKISDDSWAVGVKIGYIIPQIKWLAVELEYTYLANRITAKHTIGRMGMKATTVISVLTT